MLGIQEISSNQLLSLLNNEEEKGVNLIDVRTPAETTQGVIPGASCLPLHLISLQIEDLLSTDRSLVFYCRSGARSAQAVAFLRSQSPELDVFNLRGGIIDWMRSGHSLSPMQEARTVAV